MFPYFYEIFQREDNKEVIERTLSNILELTVDFGPGIFANQMDELTRYIILFLQKKTFCQGGIEDVEDDEHEDVKDGDDEDEDYGEEEEDDGINHDEVILGNITDLVFETARSFGNEYATHFALIAPHLVEYTSDKHPKNDKNMVFGSLSEVFAAAPGIIPTYYNDYLPLLEKNAETNDCKVIRNIAYSLGILAQHATVLFQPHVNSANILLKKLFENATNGIDIN